MPNYKTHSIHIDKTSDFIDSRIELDKEDLKVFSFGPDSLAFTDIFAFNLQHNADSKYFFYLLLKKIKEENLVDNSEMISFLYGQISHYVLDVVFHPYIYYITNNMKTNSIINAHLQVELWLDSYIMNKYSIYSENYYKKNKIEDPKVRQVIDYVYKQVYKCLFASNKYDIGINTIKLIETTTRNNKPINDICTTLNIGDISYSRDYNKIREYLNKERRLWLNPITGEERIESVNELWNEAVGLFIETIEEVNAYLYDQKPLKNRLIDSNLSYDTALPCNTPKKFIYAKKY